MNTSRLDHYYVVSMRKFMVLFIGTMGMYQLYWFYRMFKSMEVVQDRKLLPILRTLLSFIFALGLFNFIYREERNCENGREWRPDFLAGVFVGSWAVQMLVILGSSSLPAMVYFLIQLLAFFAQFYAVYQVQLAVNRIAKDPFGHVNPRMTTTNLLWVLFGTFLWADAVLKIYLYQTGRLPNSTIEQPADKLKTSSMPGVL